MTLLYRMKQSMQDLTRMVLKQEVGYPLAYVFLYSLYCFLFVLVGELCSYIETTMSATLRGSCADLNTYTNSLRLSGSCSNGTRKPGRLVWTPNENTPDIVYYQVHVLCILHICSMDP